MTEREAEEIVSWARMLGIDAKAGKTTGYLGHYHVRFNGGAPWDDYWYTKASLDARERAIDQRRSR